MTRCHLDSFLDRPYGYSTRGNIYALWGLYTMVFIIIGIGGIGS
jgi:hypothetical protein